MNPGIQQSMNPTIQQSKNPRTQYSGNPRISVDRTKGILRPKASEKNVNLIRKAGEANGTTSGSTTYAKKAAAGGIVPCLILNRHILLSHILLIMNL